MRVFPPLAPLLLAGFLGWIDGLFWRWRVNRHALRSDADPSAANGFRVIEGLGQNSLLRFP